MVTCLFICLLIILQTFWSNYNNTDPNPVITDVEDISPYDGSTVERKRWLNGDNCSSVQELKVIGGDHDWPGVFGNMDINATNEIWNFVSKYDINGLINCNTSSLQNINKADRKILKIYDFLGREVLNLNNKKLIYLYDDGSVEKLFNIL